MLVRSKSHNKSVSFYNFFLLLNLCLFSMELLNSFSLKSPDLKKNHLSESSYVLDAAFAYEGSVTNVSYGLSFLWIFFLY